jgi:hypothetical protein
MNHARVIWPPHPFAAGFCITDDPDASTYEQTRAVYDYLLAREFPTTKAVWAFPPSEPCGIPPTPPSTLRGITLTDDRYRSYCAELSRRGFEICLHGASAGNNIRRRTRDALDLLHNEIGASDTFICHSKNAENIYWEEKTTTLFPFGFLLRRYGSHATSGEQPDSPYFWGDLCATRINQIRLFRTRITNTLRRNPSMPYHDPRKPFVNGWFSATKRSLADCAAPLALDRLKREHGLTVLYQYLHRYAHPETLALDSRFTASIDRIAADPRILVGTVSSIMLRLRQVQGIFAVTDRSGFRLINTNEADVDMLQIVTDRAFSVASDDCRVFADGATTVIHRLPGLSISSFRCAERVAFPGRMILSATAESHAHRRLPLGELRVNLSDEAWNLLDGRTIDPNSFLLDTHLAGTGTPVVTALTTLEEFKMLFDQFAIIAREVLFKGRSLDAAKYLDGTREIRLENHDTW